MSSDVCDPNAARMTAGNQDQPCIFHCFQDLPAKLRIKIWEMTAFPRIIRIRSDSYKHPSVESLDDIIRVKSWPNCPPVMQVCQESRRHAPYVQAFTIGKKPRYTWVNFSTDMISIAHDRVWDHALQRHYPEIQRLQIDERGGIHTWANMSRRGNEMLAPYTSLRELYIVITYNIYNWRHSCVGHCFGPCPRENVRFVQPTTGGMMTPDQVATGEDFWDEEPFHGRVSDLDSDDYLSDEIEYTLSGNATSEISSEAGVQSKATNWQWPEQIYMYKPSG